MRPTALALLFAGVVIALGIVNLADADDARLAGSIASRLS